MQAGTLTKAQVSLQSKLRAEVPWADTAPPPGSLNRGQAHHCCPAGTVPQMPTNCYGCHKGSLKDPLRGPARVPPVTPEDALTTATGKRDANFSPAQCLGPGDLQSYCEPG